jgi:hypothetical protein
VTRRLRCFLGFCSCKPASDDAGVWGECVHCGKRFGFVTRAQLRAYADAEQRREAALQQEQGS